MSDSLLKKEFKHSDVERARNLITGNYEKSTKNIIGFSEDRCPTFHEEGDIWEENGKTWTIEDGLKVSIPKLNKAAKVLKIPFTCPKCGKALNTRLDKKMFPIHGMCFECVTRFEDALRRAGLYKDYEKEMITKNIESYVLDLKNRINTMRRSTDVSVVAEDGTVENWGKISAKLLDDLDSYAETLLEHVVQS